MKAVGMTGGEMRRRGSVGGLPCRRLRACHSNAAHQQRATVVLAPRTSAAYARTPNPERRSAVGSRQSAVGSRRSNLVATQHIARSKYHRLGAAACARQLVSSWSVKWVQHDLRTSVPVSTHRGCHAASTAINPSASVGANAKEVFIADEQVDARKTRRWFRVAPGL